MRRTPATVVLKAMTWARDSHGLFDYESRHVAKQNLRTSQSGRIVRSGNDLQVVSDFAPDPADSSRTLARLSYKDGNFYVGQGDRQNATGQGSAPEKLWLVVRSLRATNGVKGYGLQEGDIIKLGRVKLRVKEICTTRPEGAPLVSAAADSPDSLIDETQDADIPLPSTPENDDPIVEDLTNSAFSTANNSSGEENANNSVCCRICLCDNDDLENPLISPCRCKGTMKGVHLQCLRSWVEGRLNLNNTEPNFSFFWRALDCELCKVPYPTYVEVDGKQIELFKIPKPESPYIILEALSRERQSTNRGIHVISFANKSVVKLGRGHDSDVRVSDISVSRCHAMIRLVKDQFYLEDNTSKFGTLVQVKRPLLIETGNAIALQIGRTVVSFGLRRPWNFLPACFRSASSTTTDVNPLSNGSS
eukprot:GILJ01000436.1.p1 GENE.GILJ01000436.1~~GILJ01000436.1.p1  ORF type:complete len:419 (-),score=28.51 GILJ01000436.1:210-1466(-)